MDRLKTILLFVAVFLIANFFLTRCLGIGNTNENVTDGNVHVEMKDNAFDQGKVVTLTITNGSKEILEIANLCPEPAINVYKVENNQNLPLKANLDIDCSKAEDITIAPGDRKVYQFTSWNHALFGELGTYKVAVVGNLGDENIEIFSNTFQIEKAGIFRQLWTGLIHKPIYNALIAIAAFTPGHNLGIAIILLTILIRTLLLVPSGKAMRAQKKMQEVQPKLEEIRTKHKGDQQRIAMETMALWKEAKVSPMGSCLPLLLQFPFLIAIFRAVQEGINPDNSYLLYTTYNNIGLSDITTSFLGLELLDKSIYVLPVIVGLLQFLQLKLATMRASKKKQTMSGDTAKANQAMTYMMPVLIAVFTASLPSGVGIYWGTSTLYGIIQQMVINNSPDKPHKKKKNEVSVKVIQQ